MTPKRISRRNFIKAAGLAAGGATLACCGLAYAVAQPAQTGPDEPVATPSTSFGKETNMQKSILVVYATRTGSTVGVAEQIGATLAQQGYAVDVKPAHADPDPAGYQGVVIGSAVNGAQWLPEASQYVRRRRESLRQVPVGLFCVHILNLGSDERSRKNRLAYLNDIRAALGAGQAPMQEGYFAGMGMNPENTAPLLRWIMRLTNFIPDGDARDWQKINTWADQLFV